jgi:4-aminobutyrate aminotransferase-like enzyme
LSRMIESNPRIGDVRGAGLYVGVEIVSDADAKTPDRAGARALVNAMRERRVLISVCGHDGNVLKIRPPLVFSMSDVDWFCTEFEAALAV